MAQLGDGDLDAFEGAQYGDGGGDHAVAEEEGRAEEAQPHQEPAPALLEDEGKERQDPALPAVVEPHDDEDVLHGHDQDERPHDEGKDAVDSSRIPRQAHLRAEAGAEGIERAGADVAVDHAQGGEGEDAQPASPRPRSITRDGGSGVMAPLGHWSCHLSVDGHGVFAGSSDARGMPRPGSAPRAPKGGYLLRFRGRQALNVGEKRPGKNAPYPRGETSGG